MNSEVLGVSLTIAATIISVYNTILFYRQSKLVEKQTLIQRSRVYPHVRIRETNVVEDTFKLALENMSEAPAFRLGLLVACVFPKAFCFISECSLEIALFFKIAVW